MPKPRLTNQIDTVKSREHYNLNRQESSETSEGAPEKNIETSQ